MAIYARCCGKDHGKSKRKCPVCGKNFEKFVVRIKNTATGKSRTKTVYSYSQAVKVESKFRADDIEDRFFDKKKAGSINFASYLDYAKVHKKTWETDEARWRKHVADKNYLTQSGISKIMKDMVDEGYAPATVDHVFKLVRRVFNWHIQNGEYAGENPCKTIRPPKYDNKVTTFLSKQQVHDLLDYLHKWENKRASYVVLFALYTGRRKGEIINLRWDDVDLEQKTITCRNTKNGRSLSFPLNGSALEIIQNSQQIKISEFVFPSATGSNYYKAFNTSWRKLKKRLELTYRFHDLRHTYASYLASSGKVDIYTLKTLLGHQDISLTMRYAHLTNEAVKKATCVMDDLF